MLSSHVRCPWFGSGLRNMHDRSSDRPNSDNSHYKGSTVETIKAKCLMLGFLKCMEVCSYFISENSCRIWFKLGIYSRSVVEAGKLLREFDSVYISQIIAYL